MFSYKPEYPLLFEGGKLLLISCPSNMKFEIFSSSIFTGLTALMGMSLMLKLKNLSSTDIALDFGIWLGYSTFTVAYFYKMLYTARKVYLLEDGQHILVEAYIHGQKSKKFKISSMCHQVEIDRPKDNLIKFSDEIVLKTITYFLPNDPSYIYPDIVKAILLKEDITIREGSG